MEKSLKIPVRWVRSFVMIFLTVTFVFLGYLFLIHIKDGFPGSNEAFTISYLYLIPEVTLAYVWCIFTSVSFGLISPWRPTKTLRVRDFIIAGLLWGFSLWGFWFFNVVFALAMTFFIIGAIASFAIAAGRE